MADGRWWRTRPHSRQQQRHQCRHPAAAQGHMLADTRLLARSGGDEGVVVAGSLAQGRGLLPQPVTTAPHQGGWGEGAVLARATRGPASLCMEAVLALSRLLPWPHTQCPSWPRGSSGSCTGNGGARHPPQPPAGHHLPTCSRLGATPPGRMPLVTRPAQPHCR